MTYYPERVWKYIKKNNIPISARLYDLITYEDQKYVIFRDYEWKEFVCFEKRISISLKELPAYDSPILFPFTSSRQSYVDCIETDDTMITRLVFVGIHKLLSLSRETDIPKKIKKELSKKSL